MIIVFRSIIDKNLLLIHWILILINNIYLTNNINNNIINLIFVIIFIDIISIINILFIKQGDNIWYYFLYQSIITILIWWIIIIDYLYLLPFCYYNKLGSGIGGYYIPNLYYNILNYKYGINLLIYIGISNIILMIIY